ncbi:MAG: AhpC/TSA family, partial [Blastocatellia bacterium]
MTRIAFLIFAVAGVALPTFGQQATSQPAPAPAFKLKEINGRTVRLSNYKGKVVLLN